jgi:hypothetical protein
MGSSLYSRQLWDAARILGVCVFYLANCLQLHRNASTKKA